MNIKDKIIELLNNSNNPMLTAESLAERARVHPGEIRMFQAVLDDMTNDGQLVFTKKKKYTLPKNLGFITGRLQGNPKGFGFLIPDDKSEADVFIFAENLNGAMHKDRIMVKLIPSYSAGSRSREGEVVKVLTRANKTLVGTFERSRNFGFVVADEKKINQDIFVSKDDMNSAKTADKVVVEITRWPDGRRNAEGRIVEILGHKDDVGTDILSIARQYELPEKFSEESMSIAAAINKDVRAEGMAGRKDLRNMRIITIDGPDAKDLDDAVSLEKLSNGNYYLGVHIADVSHYVKEGEPLDEDALKRGTSVYLVDRVIPMLPPELSNGICSLNPKVDRLTLSVFMEIDNTGKVVDYKVEETVIRTVERMIYTDVTKILEDNDEQLVLKYSQIIGMLRDMEKLMLILYSRRNKRGSIDFDFDEPKITLDLKGKAKEIKVYERGIADRIIEEFMLICNETVAEHVHWKNYPFIFRIHPEPDLKKLLEFNEFLNNFGYRLKGAGGQIYSKAFQELLEKIKGAKEERIISTVMLRTLQKAIYSHLNLGHFGLAAKHYCHFTSPIRRYPDLLIHRIIKEDLHGRMSKKRVARLQDLVSGIAEHCSERERMADEVERETEKLKKAEYMLDKIGMEFDGIISGVTSFGIYVELENTVEGLVHISAIEDDYYVHDEKHHCLIGERKRKIYRLGDSARIKVVGASVANRTIDFTLAESLDDENGD
jgi:ribonuclease R